MNTQTAIKQLNLLSKNPREMRLAAESWNSDFKILIATILSARTRDEITIPTAEKLFEKYPTAEKLAKAKIESVKKIIRPVNFYQNKSKNIIACAKTLGCNYHGEVPSNLENLIKLPGVGRKTANVFLSEIGDSAIGVDTHVSYISQKLGWTNNKNPHKIEEDLKKLFPKKHWGKINQILVRFGKTHTSRKQKDKILEEIRRVK
ncbi:MAG: endonuclease III [archaeon]